MWRRSFVGLAFVLLIAAPAWGQAVEGEKGPEYWQHQKELIRESMRRDGLAKTSPAEIVATYDRAERGHAAALVGGIGILAAGAFGLDNARGAGWKYKRPWICLTVTGVAMFLAAVLPMAGRRPGGIALP